MRRFVLLSLLTAPAWALAGTIQVPDAGASIATLADALAVAQPGDTILLAAGNYGEANTITLSNLVIEGQGTVALLGLAGSCSASQPPLRIENATGVELRNLHLTGGGASQCGGPSSLDGPGSAALVVTDSEVTLQDCQLTAGSEMDALVATDSTLTLGSSTLQGSSGVGYFYYSGNGLLLYFTPTPGREAATLVRSSLDATDSQFTGGRGGTGGYDSRLFGFLRGENGGAGISATESGTITLASCTVTGGKGGARSSVAAGKKEDGGDEKAHVGNSGGTGGCGISGDAAVIVTPGDSTVSGGAAGDGGGTLAVPGDAYCGVSVPSSITGWNEFD
jgi:hypothetical protein